MRGGNTERAQAQPSRPHEPRPPPGLGVRGYSLAFPAATLVGFTWRGVTPRSAESRWRMSCDGNFSRANTCSSTTRTGREMFQRGALMSRFAGSVGAAKRGEGGSAGGAAGGIEYPRPEYPRPKGQTPLPHATPGGLRARAPPPPAPPPFRRTFAATAWGRDELADGADVHRFVVIWRTGTRRSARGVGVDEGSQATITWQKRSQAPLQAF